MDALAIDAEQQRGAYVIRLQGELDHDSCHRLGVALDQAEHARTDRIILDLEELTYIDSAGLEALLEIARRSADNGHRLQLTRGRGFVADMFRLTGLEMTLPLIDPSLCRR